MENHSENNKRIAKNTIVLYIRTLVTMFVGLYTGRLMLEALGVEDYGINAVVGGLIAFSSLMTNAMTQAISRYITYSLGKGDKAKLQTMFSTSVNAQICMALIAAIFLEIIGVWFLNTEAKIPIERMEAANWVLHCSIFTLVIILVSSPFTALIVAHERMSAYAYTSIADAIFKLGICFLVLIYGGDKLIFLAFLHIIEVLLMRFFYGWYCSRNFEEAHYSPKVFDKGLLKELTIFSGWNLMNNGTYVFATQGVNMLINVFFGVVFNATRSVVNTINCAIQGFVNNFTMAFSPQITKSYASGDKEYSIKLVNRGFKFTWLMMLVFIVPVCMEAEMLLSIWLVEVPVMAALFLRFAMFEALSVTVGQNLFRLIMADGRVQSYTIHAAITAGMIFPLVWLVYYLGAPVWSSYLIFIFAFVLLHFIRIYDIKKLMKFSLRLHFKESLSPCVIVSVTSFILPLVIAYFMEDSLIRFFVMTPTAVLWTCFCCYVFGLNEQERDFCKDKVVMVLRKLHP